MRALIKPISHSKSGRYLRISFRRRVGVHIDESFLAKIKAERFYDGPDGCVVRVMKVDWRRNLVVCRNYCSHTNQSFALDEAAKIFVPLFKIKDIARMFGKKTATIRKYENMGLLPEPRKISLNRSGRASTRVYSPNDIEVITEFFDRRRPVGRPGPLNTPGINRNAVKTRVDASYLKVGKNG